MRSFLTKSVVACAALPLVAAMQSGEDDPGQALRGGTLLVGDGSIHEDALLWIRDGKGVDFGSDFPAQSPAPSASTPASALSLLILLYESPRRSPG